MALDLSTLTPQQLQQLMQLMQVTTQQGSVQPTAATGTAAQGAAQQPQLMTAQQAARYWDLDTTGGPAGLGDALIRPESGAASLDSQFMYDTRGSVYMPRGTGMGGLLEHNNLQGQVVNQGGQEWVPRDIVAGQYDLEGATDNRAGSGGIFDSMDSFLSNYGPLLAALPGFGVATGVLGGGLGTGLPGSAAGLMGEGTLAGLPAGQAGSFSTVGAGAGSAFPTTAAEIAAANQAAAAAIGEGVATGTSGMGTTIGTGAGFEAGSAFDFFNPSTWTAESISNYLTNPANLAQTAGSQLLQQAGDGGADNTGAFDQHGSMAYPNGTGTGTIFQQGATSAAGQSALSRILNGQGTAADWAQIAGSVGSTALGVLGSNAQSDAMRDMQNQYLALGAPSRARLESSYQPGFSIWNEPGARDAATQAADISARSYSAQGGNPFGNPNAQSGIYQNVLAGVGLPQLNTYRSQNASSGQLGLNTAGTASAGLAGSSGDLYNSLGFGLASLTQPQNGLQDLLRQLGGGSNQYRLTY